MIVIKPLIRIVALLTVPLLCCFTFAFTIGCSGSDPKIPVRLPSRTDSSLGIKPPTPPCTEFVTWRQGSSVDGKLIRNQMIADGDAACAAGNAPAAAQAYQRAANSPLSQFEARELAVRRAALALGRGAAADALVTLNGYLKQFRNAEIHGDFGFLLATAYAGTGDVDQAIAWWSRVYVLENGTGSLATRSKDATFELLRRVDDASLARAQEVWRDDDMVRTALAQARGNRLSPGQIAERIEEAHRGGDLAVSGENLGVLLPLTGRFQALGERARRGVELALSAHANPGALVAVDSGESASLVREKLAELVKSDVQTIIGPLLAEQVDDVAIAAPSGSMVLSLSKRGPVIPSVNFWSLGITAEAQVDSILTHARSTIGITQLAVVGSTEAMETFGELVRNGMRDRSISLVLERSFAKEDIAAATDIGRELSVSSAQAVLFLDNAAVSSNIAVGISEEDRRNIKFLGLAAWDSEAQLQQARAVLNGARFVSGFPRSSSRNLIVNFIATYQQRYRENPDVVAAQAFDAASLVMAARSRQRSGESIVAAFQNLPPFEGLTGRIENLPGVGVVRSLPVLQFQNGIITELQ